MQAYASEEAGTAFAASYTRFDGLVAWLAGDQAAETTLGELEDRLHTEGLALLRQLLQDSLDLRAVREQRLAAVVDADGYRRGRAEGGHERGLATRFGPVNVARIAYRARGRANLHPADAALNLPVEKHSHGLRKLAAVEAARGSFADASAAIGRATGVRLGRRQVEELAARAAIDVDGFYTAHAPAPAPDDVLVLSFDAKGVVMRPDGLRAATAKAAASQKLVTRLSKGEKRNRKRMAEVAAVYDEADRRDPDHQRAWVALVDGNAHQIDRIRAEARARKRTVPIVVDFIHVLEYICKAAYHGRDPGKRKAADTAAAYLLAKKPYLDYPTALDNGWPIATGVIEGACRHLVKDRLDITGARWGLDGAEAILKLRAMTSNGDFDQYWTWHLTQEQQRIHNDRYLGGVIPTQ